MSNMFCFQCEQTASGRCCDIVGVCGKKAITANLMDKLTGALIGLSRVCIGNKLAPDTYRLIIEGLFTTVTNVNFNNETIQKMIDKTEKTKKELMKTFDLKKSKVENYDLNLIWNDIDNIRSLKSLILFGLRGMSAYAYHSMTLLYWNDEVNNFFLKGLVAIGEDLSPDELLSIVDELGKVNLKCMEMLDRANTDTFGTPAPIKVPLTIEKGPFIVISGHDLRDLYMLLEKTKDKGINIYTHGEMLPAHAYPKLKSFPHLKGNFGTAWQNQQKEFENIPAPVLFTTNCLMPVKESYKDRVFTTEVVSYPELMHIGPDKDFTPIINKALELGGYIEDKKMTGINGGDTVTTGFAREAVLSVADKIVDAVKSGAIKHFFLVGGCDGSRPGRNYYTDFVKLTPKDTMILTLACGKYRFNDLDLGEIGGFPRILDMGQCNDAYSAIQVAIALSDAFECDINDLPLTLVLSWYEQKAVVILLTLLSLGIKNIYIGPSLPAFLSFNVLKVLIDKYQLTPISTPKEDLKKIFGMVKV